MIFFQILIILYAKNAITAVGTAQELDQPGAQHANKIKLIIDNYK